MVKWKENIIYWSCHKILAVVFAEEDTVVDSSFYWMYNIQFLQVWRHLLLVTAIETNAKILAEF